MTNKIILSILILVGGLFSVDRHFGEVLLLNKDTLNSPSYIVGFGADGDTMRIVKVDSLGVTIGHVDSARVSGTADTALHTPDSVRAAGKADTSSYSWLAYLARDIEFTGMESGGDTVLMRHADSTIYGITPANLRTLMGALTVNDSIHEADSANFATEADHADSSDVSAYSHQSGNSDSLGHQPALYYDTVGNGQFLKLDQTAPQSVINGDPYFTSGIKTPNIYPNADGVTALQFLRADGTTPVMNINTTSSRVGIGTIAPATQFHIEGASAGISLHRSGDEPFIRLSNTGITTGGQLRGLASAGGLRFTNVGSTVEWVRISSLGYVGILTNVPRCALEVNGFIGSINANPLWFLGPDNSTVNSTNYHTIGYAGGDNYHITGSTTGDLTVGARAGENIVLGTSVSGTPVSRIIILADGKVAITTPETDNTPDYLLTQSGGTDSTVKRTDVDSITVGNALHTDSADISANSWNSYRLGGNLASYYDTLKNGIIATKLNISDTSVFMRDGQAIAQSQITGLVDSLDKHADTLGKYKNHANLNNLNSASYTHLTATNHTDLTDGGNSALHIHDADRARANHTGTQAISTVVGLGDSISNHRTLILAREPTITAGTTSQYWRGDKSWQAHNTASVTGLHDSLAAKLPLHGKSDSSVIADSTKKVPFNQSYGAYAGNKFYGNWASNQSSGVNDDKWIKVITAILVGNYANFYFDGIVYGRRSDITTVPTRIWGGVRHDGAAEWYMSKLGIDKINSVGTIPMFDNAVWLQRSVSNPDTIDLYLQFAYPYNDAPIELHYQSSGATIQILNGTTDTLTTYPAGSDTAFINDSSYALYVAGTKEPAITAGTASQFWSWDKTWRAITVPYITGATDSFNLKLDKSNFGDSIRHYNDGAIYKVPIRDGQYTLTTDSWMRWNAAHDTAVYDHILQNFATSVGKPGTYSKALFDSIVALRLPIEPEIIDTFVTVRSGLLYKALASAVRIAVSSVLGLGDSLAAKQDTVYRSRAGGKNKVAGYYEWYPGDGYNLNPIMDFIYTNLYRPVLRWVGDRFVIKPVGASSDGRIVVTSKTSRTAWTTSDSAGTYRIAHTDTADVNDSTTAIVDTTVAAITKTSFTTTFGDVADSDYVITSKAGSFEGQIHKGVYNNVWSYWDVINSHTSIFRLLGKTALMEADSVVHINPNNGQARIGAFSDGSYPIVVHDSVIVNASTQFIETVDFEKSISLGGASQNVVIDSARLYSTGNYDFRTVLGDTLTMGIGIGTGSVLSIVTGKANIGGTLNIGTVYSQSTDPDKYLVLSGDNDVKYRTGSQVISDGGGIYATSFDDSIVGNFGTLTATPCTLFYTGGNVVATGTSYYKNGSESFSINIPTLDGSSGPNSYYYIRVGVDIPDAPFSGIYYPVHSTATVQFVTRDVFDQRQINCWSAYQPVIDGFRIEIDK